MKKQFFYLLFFLSFSLIFSAFSQNTESITISTYYPAPYGVYQTLRLYPSDTQPPCVSADTDSGTMYYDSGSGELMFCGRDINGNLSWQSSASLWIRSGNSVYLRNNAWRVGIGTDNVVGMLVMYEHETQGAIHLAGKGDSGTYSGLFLDDDDENFTNRNTWHITHKKDTGAVSENDFHITRWVNTNIGRTDLVIDSATGNIGIGTYNPQAKLDVAGEARIGGTGLACSADTAGGLRYNNDLIEYCDGVTGWQPIRGRKICHGAYATPTLSTVNNSWGDYLPVPDSWTQRNCFDFYNNQHPFSFYPRAGYVQVGCLWEKGKYSLKTVYYQPNSTCDRACTSDFKAVPSPNCGW